MDQEATTSCFYFDRLCKASVSLNNSAVALLSKGLICEAMDTIKDAIKLLNVASCINVHNIGCSPERMQRVEAFLDSSLHLALKRMSLPAAADSKGQIVHLVKPLSNAAMAYTIFKDTSLLPFDPMPIFIDLIPVEEEGSEDDAFDIECAILLYNFGLAHRLLATTMTATSESARIRNSLKQSSFCFLEMARTLLSKIDEFNQQAVFLHVLLTRALIQSCLDLGRSPDEYRRVFTRLYAIARGKHEFFPLQYESRGAAAA
jgi:hypothetical protein